MPVDPSIHQPVELKDSMPFCARAIHHLPSPARRLLGHRFWAKEGGDRCWLRVWVSMFFAIRQLLATPVVVMFIETLLVTKRTRSKTPVYVW